MLNWVQVDHSELLRHLTTPDGESESEGPAQMEICPPPPPPVPRAPASFLTALETSSPSSPLLTAFLGWSQTTCFLPPRCWHTPALTWGVSPGGGPDEGESWGGGGSWSQRPRRPVPNTHLSQMGLASQETRSAAPGKERSHQGEQKIGLQATLPTGRCGIVTRASVPPETSRMPLTFWLAP